MKKTYINPELQVVVMQTTGMLALSNPGLKDNNAVGPGMAHEFDFDEDEDEEDY